MLLDMLLVMLVHTQLVVCFVSLSTMAAISWTSHYWGLHRNNLTQSVLLLTHLKYSNMLLQYITIEHHYSSQHTVLVNLRTHDSSTCT